MTASRGFVPGASGDSKARDRCTERSPDPGEHSSSADPEGSRTKPLLETDKPVSSQGCCLFWSWKGEEDVEQRRPRLTDGSRVAAPAPPLLRAHIWLVPPVGAFSPGGEARASVSLVLLWPGSAHGLTFNGPWQVSRSSYDQHLRCPCSGQAVMDSGPLAHACVSRQPGAVTDTALPGRLEELEALTLKPSDYWHLF